MTVLDQKSLLDKIIQAAEGDPGAVVVAPSGYLHRRFGPFSRLSRIWALSSSK